MGPPLGRQRFLASHLKTRAQYILVYANAEDLLELALSTRVTPGEDDGESQNEESNASNERHFEREITRTTDGVGVEDDEPEMGKKRENDEVSLLGVASFI